MRGLTVTSNYLPDPQVNGVNCWEAYGFKRRFETMVISSQVDYFGLYAIIEL
jgi:hypothetical protein